MKVKKFFIILIFIVGFVIFTYPSINKKISDYQIKKTIGKFNNSKDELKTGISFSDLENGEELEAKYNKEEISNLYNEMREYNEKIYLEKQSGLVDPFAYENNSFDLTRFGLENNVIGYISIPKINIEIPIYLGATQQNMKYGGGNLGETSIPIGGINTNSVIAAHRGMKTHPMFRDIEELHIGDEITINNLWEELTYEVVETKVITPSEIEEILIQEGKDLITLITCHPYTKNYQRYIVFCERKSNGIVDDTKINKLDKNDIEDGLTKGEKVLNIITIENFFRYIGMILIITIMGYAGYKLIINKKVNNKDIK